jgi:uncharacterized protein YbbC (DUF1343 family)
MLISGIEENKKKKEKVNDIVFPAAQFLRLDFRIHFSPYRMSLCSILSGRKLFEVDTVLWLLSLGLQHPVTRSF